MQHGIEAGARSGMVAVDNKTIEYFRGRPYRQKANTGKAVAYWRTPQERCRCRIRCGRRHQWRRHQADGQLGHVPEMVVAIDQALPDPDKETDPVGAEGMRRAYKYMDLARHYHERRCA